MKLCSVDELKGNEILDKAVMTSDYQILLSGGTQLRAEYIDKLKELDITEVFIRDEEPHAEAIEILKDEIEQMFRDKVKSILEMHTYQHNEQLIEIGITADKIIEEIISDKNIVEQVFDIKERNSDIYEHSISICSLAILTALKLGGKKENIHDLGVGCLLHDIGLRYLTIHYENQDLSELSDIEIAEYKKHPVYGYSSLKNETWIGDIGKNIILYHHERLDGSGYPLRAKEIPYESRIVNVCDAFDEMICGIGCKRVKVHEAVEYLKTFKNNKFDDKIVEAFLEFTAVYPAGSQVITNEGETGIVIKQNKEFPDRPVILIIQDKNGKKVDGNVVKDLLKVNHVFIERVIN